MMIITGMASVCKKLLKLNPDAAPIKIFGGSPIKVAVPPILLARMIGIIRAKGFILNIRVIWSAIGVISITVVTLSRNADRIAVVRTKRVTSLALLPFDIRNNLRASHSKTPVSDRTPTTIIIPVKSQITS